MYSGAGYSHPNYQAEPTPAVYLTGHLSAPPDKSTGIKTALGRANHPAHRKLARAWGSRQCTPA